MVDYGCHITHCQWLPVETTKILMWQHYCVYVCICEFAGIGFYMYSSVHGCACMHVEMCNLCTLKQGSFTKQANDFFMHNTGALLIVRSQSRNSFVNFNEQFSTKGSASWIAWQLMGVVLHKTQTFVLVKARFLPECTCENSSGSEPIKV